MALEEGLDVARIGGEFVFGVLISEDVKDGIEVFGNHVVGSMGSLHGHAVASGAAKGKLCVSELLIFRGYRVHDMLFEKEYCFCRTLQSEVKVGNMLREQRFNKIVFSLFQWACRKQ